MEKRVAYLRPGQVVGRLKKSSVIFVPVAPMEWHGPHLPLGVDAFDAEEVAMGVCEKVGGCVWPTLFWGSERERSPKELGYLGFKPHEYVVGMDFPKNCLPSPYSPEDVFGVVIRETLRLVGTMGPKLAVLVNGHGAFNHIETLKRLAIEFTNTTDLRVYFRLAFPQDLIDAGTIAHAGADETSLMMYFHPETVDLKTLPPKGKKFKYRDFAIVDGPGFEGKGRPDKIVEDDPRTLSSVERGRKFYQRSVNEIAEEVRLILKGLK